MSMLHNLTPLKSVTSLMYAQQSTPLKYRVRVFNIKESTIVFSKQLEVPQSLYMRAYEIWSKARDNATKSLMTCSKLIAAEDLIGFYFVLGDERWEITACLPRNTNY